MHLPHHGLRWANGLRRTRQVRVGDAACMTSELVGEELGWRGIVWRKFHEISRAFRKRKNASTQTPGGRNPKVALVDYLRSRWTLKTGLLLDRI